MTCTNCILWFVMFAVSNGSSTAVANGRNPLVRVVDLNIGESEEVALHNGAMARIRLLERNEVHDSVRGAVRVARVRAEINGKEVTLECGTYRLPVTVAGVQADCTVTRGYLENSRSNIWGLDKDARLRLWPAGSPLLAPGTYRYPVRQHWFASDTQMANEPSFVDGSEEPSRKTVYYHYGLDIGGGEGLAQVVSATDGLWCAGERPCPSTRIAPIPK
jgi:hypothetical protein